MPLNAYLVCFLAGAAALALWVDTRMPRWRPGLTWKLLAHFVLSTLLARVNMHHLLLALATVTYVLLVALWVIRALQEHMQNPGGGLPTKG